MKYYIPEWQDLVTADYDFWHDKDRSPKRVYAHQLYNTPNYDGILISRMKLETTKKVMQNITAVGLHKFYDFKGKFFGDTGAWSYVNDPKPPYKSKEMLVYYHQLGFDYGVSIDHLALDSQTGPARVDLTRKNAEEFFQLHEANGYSFTPVGACQGYDLQSYYESFEELLDIGYNYIALGGIARSQTTQIISILQHLQPLITQQKIDLHLFGAARLEATRIFQSLGVTSFDSASPLRSAWLGSSKNFRDMTWNGYSAIRLPFVSRTKKLLDRARDFGFTADDAAEFEQGILAMLYEFDTNGTYSIDEILDAFENFDNQFAVDSKGNFEMYRKLLTDQPWKSCSCKICKETGIDVVIFRGNNRNRRRGFHNTYVFYYLLQKILHDPNFNIPPQIGASPTLTDFL